MPERLPCEQKPLRPEVRSAMAAIGGVRMDIPQPPLRAPAYLGPFSSDYKHPHITFRLSIADGEFLGKWPKGFPAVYDVSQVVYDLASTQRCWLPIGGACYDAHLSPQ